MGNLNRNVLCPEKYNYLEYFIDLFSLTNLISTNDDDEDDEDDDNDELFLWYGWPTKGA